MTEQKYPVEVELTTKNGHRFRLVIHKDPTSLELSAKQALSKMRYRRSPERRPRMEDEH